MGQLRKATGARGSWFARVGEESLPCIHKHWLDGLHYHEPFFADSERQWIEFLDGVRLGKVILTTDNVVAEDLVTFNDGTTVLRPTFQRSGYVAVFRIDNLLVEGRHLRFDLVERIENLR